MRYLVELGAATERRGWVNAFRIGEWVHDLYGRISITQKVFDEIVKNFRANATGHELPIDYQHSTNDPSVEPDKQGEAAGWVKDIKVEGDRLYILVEWLESAAEKIKAGAFRYFSPTFDTAYKNKESGEELGITLLGGALTNTPFLTDLDPILLSETIKKPAGQSAAAKIYNLSTNFKERNMELGKLTPEQLAVFVEVFDKTEGDPLVKLDEAMKAAEAYVAEPEKKKEAEPPAEEKPELTDEQKAEMEKLVEENKTLRERVRATEVENILAQLRSPSNGKTLTEPVINKVKAILTAQAGSEIKLSDKATFTSPLDAFVALLGDIKDGGLVTLVETTHLKSQKPETEMELTEELRAKYRGASDDSIRLAEISDNRWNALPKKEQTFDAYKKIQQAVAAELNTNNQ